MKDSLLHKSDTIRHAEGLNHEPEDSYGYAEVSFLSAEDLCRHVDDIFRGRNMSSV